VCRFKNPFLTKNFPLYLTFERSVHLRFRPPRTLFDIKYVFPLYLKLEKDKKEIGDHYKIGAPTSQKKY
jgi:hypothetical protein